MKIRTASNADRDPIKELIFGVLNEYGLRYDSNGTDSDLEDIEQNFLCSGGVFAVMEDEYKCIVGTVALSPLNRETCMLRKMYLAAAVRGQGLGKRLLNHALDRARELGFSSVELETACVLKEAIHLYSRHGFRPIDKKCISDRCDQAYVLHFTRE